ncbi:MAG: amino acid ABC transporter substrate-binding protein [Firmicutes bacterium]|nr:amino acid ABC transporter substrate-binding protein [Bacillota bacterium]
MKKLTAVLLALTLVLALGGCTEKLVDQTKKIDTAKEGVLTVAMSPDFLPMEFVNIEKEGQERFEGFDVFLANYIAEDMGLTLELVPMEFSACQSAVANGKVDLSISGYSYTKERADRFLLSDTYVAGNNGTKQTVIVAKENEGKFETAEDFQGLTICYQESSLQQKLAKAQLNRISILKGYADLGTAVEALRSGSVDGVAVAEGYAKLVTAQNPDFALSGFYFEVDDSSKDNVILVKQGSTALLTAVNKALAKAKKDELYDGWYEEAKELAARPEAYLGTYDANGNETGLKK